MTEIEIDIHIIYIIYIYIYIERERERERTYALSSISAAVARFEGSKLSIGVRKSANFFAAASSIRYCKTVESVRFGRFGTGKRLNTRQIRPRQEVG